MNLSAQAVSVLKRIHGRFKEINPYIDSPNVAFLTQFLLSLDDRLTQEWITDLAPHLTSQRLKRKVIRERLEKLADQMDDDALDKLERLIKKIEIKSENKIENGGISAEK